MQSMCEDGYAGMSTSDFEQRALDHDGVPAIGLRLAVKPERLELGRGLRNNKANDSFTINSGASANIAARNIIAEPSRINYIPMYVAHEDAHVVFDSLATTVKYNPLMERVLPNTEDRSGICRNISKVAGADVESNNITFIICEWFTDEIGAEAVKRAGLPDNAGQTYQADVRVQSTMAPLLDVPGFRQAALAVKTLDLNSARPSIYHEAHAALGGMIKSTIARYPEHYRSLSSQNR
jgi:hypothetical protein